MILYKLCHVKNATFVYVLSSLLSVSLLETSGPLRLRRWTRSWRRSKEGWNLLTAAVVRVNAYIAAHLWWQARRLGFLGICEAYSFLFFLNRSMQQPPVFPQHMEHFNTQMMNTSQDLSQQVIWRAFFLNRKGFILTDEQDKFLKIFTIQFVIIISGSQSL